MAPNTYRSFAVAGVGRTVGPAIVNSLLARNSSVVILTRPGSKKTTPEGAKLVEVDYTDVSKVTSVLKEYSVDVLISTLSGDGGFAAQTPLGDAAKAAGVKLFVPSEFGMPTEGAQEGLLAFKHQTAVYLRSINLPSLRVYTGLFQDHIAFVAGVESGKFYIVGKGDTPFSTTAITDIGEYLAYVLTTLPPEQLHDKILRIEGQRVTMNEAGKLYAAKLPVEHVDSIPSTLSLAPVLEFLQKRFESGAGSTGWSILENKEGSEPAGSSNSLYPGFKFKTLKETLGL